MKNRILLCMVVIKLSIAFSLFSCKKKQKINRPDDLNSILALSNYKTSQKEVNDSIIEISGYNEKFTIQGKYNKKSHHKLGWWDIHDKNNQKFLKVQIFLEDTIERKNQILFYHQNKIDTTRSKLYTIDFKYENNKIKKIVYRFYTPMSDFVTKNVDLIYSITTINGETEPRKLALKIKNNNRHYCEIDLSKYADSKRIVVGGLFSEYSSNKDETEMGINDIFIRDTIPIRKVSGL